MPAETKPEKHTRSRKGRQRANGEGACYFHKASGRWVAAVCFGTAKGKKRRRRYYYGATQGEALAKRDAALGAKAKGTAVPGARETVGKLLADWLEGVRITIRKSTAHSYGKEVKRVTAEIGHIRLAELSAADVRKMMARLSAAGKAVRTIRYARAVLKMALAQGVADGEVPHNVAADAKPPKLPKRRPVVFTPEEAQALLGAAAGDPIEGLYWLALTTGTREGELLGVQWPDLDLDAATWRLEEQLVEVNGEQPERGPLKVDEGARTIHLAAEVVAVLRRAKDAAPADIKTGEPLIPWCFPDSHGGPLRRSNFLRRQWAPLLARAEVPSRSFHTTRHTVASAHLAAGRNVVAVAAEMGWSSPRVLLDTYGHAPQGREREAPDAITRWLKGAK